MTEAFVVQGLTPPVLARRLPAHGRDRLVLSLDFWTSRSLAAAGTPFRTPAEYLDGVDFARLDRTAREMAAAWHRPIADRFRYREIPLGEMVEAEVLGLLIDAVRSVEVANRFLTAEKPSAVRLMPSGGLPEPIGLCYATLPRALESVARQQGIPTTRIDQRAVRASAFSPIRAAIVRESRNALQATVPPKFVEPARRGTGQGTVLFLDQAGFESIAPRLRERGYRSRLAMPTWRWSPSLAAERQRLMDLWSSIRNDGTFFDRLRYRDAPILEIVRPWIAWFIRRRALELAGIVDHAERLARTMRPIAVVTMQDTSPDCRTAARQFRVLGIPVAVVQHGAVSADMGGFHVLPKEGQIQAVWGEQSREWHLARGKPPESQVVTGNPRFDALMGYRPPERSSVLLPLGLDPTRPTVLLATEWYAGTASAYTLDGEDKVLRDVLGGLREIRSLQVVVKLHPTRQRESGPRIAEILREAAPEAVLARHDLWGLLAASDVVLVFNSTVGIEALLLDRPLVAIEYFPQAEKIPYAAWGTAVGVRGPREVGPAVARALYDEGTREALRAARAAVLDRIIFSRDGQSSGRVADLVARLGVSPSPGALRSGMPRWPP